MKKLIAILLTALLLTIGMVGALAEQGGLRPADLVNQDTRFAVVRSGMPQSLLESARQGQLTQAGAVQSVGEPVAVETLTEGLLMLNSARVDALMTLAPTARYTAARGEGLMPVEGVYPFKLCMLINDKKPELLASVNEAIVAMRADGTLDKLWDEHVTLGVGEPVRVTIPKGKTVVRVGVSGDIPPMDYVSASGEPAGYNTAMLAEISKRADFDMQFVYMDAGARFAALSSGRIDLFFWQLEVDLGMSDGFTGDAEAIARDAAAEITCLMSEPYATANVGWVFRIEKAKAAMTDEALLGRAREAAEWIAGRPNATAQELQALCDELYVDDICAVGADGAIQLSNQEENIGFRFADDEQSAAFLSILADPSLELAQEPMARGADGETYRYAGVAGGLDGGLTQVGVRIAK